jgi:hypothetical protein
MRLPPQQEVDLMSDRRMEKMCRLTRDSESHKEDTRYYLCYQSKGSTTVQDNKDKRTTRTIGKEKLSHSERTIR